MMSTRHVTTKAQPDTGSHMPVITGACLFIKMTARRDLPPSSSVSDNFLCGQLIFWSPLTLLWVFSGDCRRQKINMCTDTNHNNCHSNLKKTDWTLIQYFNYAANNVNFLCTSKVFIVYIQINVEFKSKRVFLQDVLLVWSFQCIKVKMPDSLTLGKAPLPATEVFGTLPRIYWPSLGVFSLSLLNAHWPSTWLSTVVCKEIQKWLWSKCVQGCVRKVNNTLLTCTKKVQCVLRGWSEADHLVYYPELIHSPK